MAGAGGRGAQVRTSSPRLRAADERLSLGDKSNYAVLIRLALLAAMEANQGGNYLGFRCVREQPANVSGASQ